MNTLTTSRKFYAQTLLLWLAAVLLAGRAHGAPGGELDASFGEHGRMTIQLANSHFGSAISRQPADGKLLFPGYYNGDSGRQDFAVLRLNSDGSKDTTFGTNGIAIVGFGSSDAVATKLAVQPDGKIIVAGSVDMGVTHLDFALARLNSDGTINTTFGHGGVVTLDLGGGTDSISDVVLLPTGPIVVVGTTDTNGDQDAVFARFGSNGALDTTFGTGSIAGTTIVGVTGKTDELFAMLTQLDGKFVACGTTVQLDNGIDFESDMLAIRVNADGSVDTALGDNGVLLIDTGAQFSGAQSCAALPDGGIVLAGFNGEPGMVNPALVRLLPDGTRDPSFGSAGISRFTVDHIGWAQAIILLNDGRLGVTGFTSPLHNTNLPTDMFVARIDPDSGMLDSTFGDHGVTIVDFGLASQSPLVEGRGLIAQANGKLIAVGRDSRSSLALARVDPAGDGSVGFAGFIATSATVSEGTNNFVVTVRRTGGGTGNLAVDYNTIADTATVPADFTAVSGTLTWLSGDMGPKSITVPIANDDTVEGGERFSVVLSDSTGGLAASQLIVDITDNDAAAPPTPTPPPPAPSPQGGGGGALGIVELMALSLIWAFATRWRRYGDHGSTLS